MNDEQASEIVNKFASLCNILQPDFEIVDKAGEDYLVIYVGKINEIYAAALTKIKLDSTEDTPFFNNVFLKEKKPNSWVASSEAQLLQQLLSQSLTVGKATLDSDFHKKFSPFLGGEERKIYSDANHIVFGRRGAGKSSLILYAANKAKADDYPFVWIALQQYRSRKDLQVIPQILYEIVEGIGKYSQGDPARLTRLKEKISRLEDKELDITKQDIEVFLPLFSRDLLSFVGEHGKLFLFIDDLHLLDVSIQPFLLSSIYSFSRGNNIFLKIATIENLSNLYNEAKQEGLQTPGDAQVIRLDHSLVEPVVALKHIKTILNSYVAYTGIPSLSSMCGKNVVERLVWVSAGVPRDAIYIFNNSLSKALSQGRKHIAVMDVNMSAAESLTEKERNFSDDASYEADDVKRLIDDIKKFCLKEVKQNAFLVHIEPNNKKYQLIKRISDLRFIHILHPGITPEKAGEKYEAFLLDYAFYTGFRKAPSVKEFKPEPDILTAKELRKLKRYRYNDRLKGSEAPSLS